MTVSVEWTKLCFESQSVQLVHSGRVVSLICQQWKKLKVLKKLISGCGEALMLRIGKECQDGLEG